VSVRTFVIDSDPAFRIQLRNGIQSAPNIELHGEGDSPTAALEAVTGDEVDLVIVGLDRGQQAVLEQVARWKAERPGLLVFGCSSSCTSELLLAAMRAGVSEWLEKPLEATGFDAAMQRAAQMVSAMVSVGGPARPLRSHSTCVFSLRGGQGVTTVAVNTAIALAAQTAQPCVLLDLSFGLGDAAAFMDLQPQYTFANLLGADGHADPSRLQTCLMRHSSGVYYLGERESLEEPSPVSSMQLREVLTHLQASFGHVVADLWHVLDSRTYEALNAADTILLVATCEVVSVRSARYALRLLQSLGFGQGKVKVVLNRVSRRDAITPEQFAETIQYPIELKLPSAYWMVVDSVNTGNPLALSKPKSSVARGIVELSGRLHAVGSDSKDTTR
jgi:pilus assembly protein CpaE